MKISYFHDYYDRVFVDRKTAYNHYERYVYYQSPQHRQRFLDIVNRYKPNQIVVPNERLIISKLYQQELKRQDIHDENYFRKLYMINRYKAFFRNYISRSINTQKVAEEVGLHDVRRVSEVVACLESN